MANQAEAPERCQEEGPVTMSTWAGGTSARKEARKPGASARSAQRLGGEMSRQGGMFWTRNRL